MNSKAIVAVVVVGLLAVCFLMGGCEKLKEKVNEYREPGLVKSTVHIVVNVRKAGVLVGGTIVDNKLIKTSRSALTLDKRVVPGDYTLTITKGDRATYTFAFTVPEGSKVKNIVCTRSLLKFNRIRCREVE